MIESSRIKKIHFAGIGGSGMSGIAEVLQTMGFQISGSDIAENDTVRRLRALGMRIAIGHAAANVGDAGALVYSSAVTEDNVEVAEALRNKLPVIPRAEMLAELMRMKFSLAVAGTHGKTTTTSMLAAILTQARLDPTYVVGGRLKVEGSGAKLGSSRYLVAEADESDGSFLKLFPSIAVVTNIENDHLEFYGRMKNLVQAFRQFADKVPFYGAVILNSDDANVRRIMPGIRKKVVTYGFGAGADVRALKVRSSGLACRYELAVQGRPQGTVRLGVGGRHNVANSLAAIAAALEVGVGLEAITASLARFTLPERRFQVLHSSAGLLVVDDYAHHPSEIKATLRMLRAARRGGRVVVVFQPHRFTRLHLLMRQFATAFRSADLLVIAKLYTANQEEIAGVNSRVLADSIRGRGQQNVFYLESFAEISGFLDRELRPGDRLAFLSAGNLTRLAHEYAARMEALKK
ncbi:MAG: UDP-N-acetylmuramate--L-alanine ligase [Acidobacteria bacterium]|jgi:UDP-N-acetylmuramate--alanine ligase|nr:UDP-N-acetylmuramate--L-alanine ligase [Acidobacteriota bacterium]MCU0843132.1 UDP-N-acetylmuramate--L-alanine ligase [Thiobacillaceae bacterium]